jgi:hypothetical protein
MRMRARVSLPDLPGVFRDQVARDFTAAMKRETRDLEKRFEAATLSAGLGQGMARTWQSKVYPAGRDVLGPAGQIWSKAPKAMKAFTEGATITASGGRFLAIPTAEVRALRGGRNQKQPTPADIERRLGVKLVLVVKRGKRFLVAPSRDRARRRTGPRRLFVAFFLVPKAVVRKRLDLPPMVQVSMTNLRGALAAAINNAQRAVAG